MRKRTLWSGLVVCMLLVIPLRYALAQTNLVVNGNFQASPIVSGSPASFTSGKGVSFDSDYPDVTASWDGVAYNAPDQAFVPEGRFMRMCGSGIGSPATSTNFYDPSITFGPGADVMTIYHAGIAASVKAGAPGSGGGTPGHFNGHGGTTSPALD